ncbi:MAG TPA: GGDEF domain-containing protein [Thermomicrobiaceae bacterium]|nr:GGDEF domain-containing protein [Thermomicrobiaceae bacterium]
MADWLERYVARLSPGAALAATLVLVLAGNTVQYFAGTEAAAGFLCFIPIGLVTWRLGRRVGIVISIFAAGCWLTSSLAAGGGVKPVLLAWNGAARLITFLVVTYLIDELHHRLDETRAVAEQDFLTGIANARAFDHAMQDELLRAHRTGRPFTLAYLDLDNFKRINDRYGHREGDRVLYVVAHALRDCLRQVDTVARLGGDEFSILLVETDAAGARIAMRRVQLALRQLPFKVTFSLGAVTFNTAPGSVEEMMRLADDAMYAVKRAGKDGCLFRLVDRAGNAPRTLRHRVARPHPSRRVVPR